MPVFGQKFQKPQLNLAQGVSIDTINTTHIDNCTAIKIRGSGRAVSAISNQKVQYASLVGVNVIALEYIGDDIKGNVGHPFSGFQEVIFTVGTDRAGKRRFHARASVDEETHEALDHGSVTFVQNELGIAIGYVPDTPFNRIRLACCMDGPVQFWRIVDEKIREEVERLMHEIVRSKEHLEKLKNEEKGRLEIHKYVQERALKRQHRDFTEAELEAEYIKTKMRELTAQEEVKKLRREYAKLLNESNFEEAELERAVDNALSGNSDTDEDEDVGSAPIVEGKVNYRIMAKKIVYDKEKSLVAELKARQLARNGIEKGWTKVEDYKKKIAPQVDKLEKMMREKGEKEKENADKGSNKSD